MPPRAVMSAAKVTLQPDVMLALHQPASPRAAIVRPTPTCAIWPSAEKGLRFMQWR